MDNSLLNLPQAAELFRGTDKSVAAIAKLQNIDEDFLRYRLIKFLGEKEYKALVEKKRKWKILSEEEKNDIVTCYRTKQFTTKELAARFGCSSATVQKVLNQGLSITEQKQIVREKQKGVK